MRNRIRDGTQHRCSRASRYVNVPHWDWSFYTDHSVKFYFGHYRKVFMVWPILHLKKSQEIVQILWIYFVKFVKFFLFLKRNKEITNFVKSAYTAYFSFSIKLKSWTPQIVYKICVEQLEQWMKREKLSLPFGWGMMWREPMNHVYDCYFCLCKVEGLLQRIIMKLSTKMWMRIYAWFHMVQGFLNYLHFQYLISVQHHR